MKVLCFSSFTFSYLNRARALFATVKQFHDDWDCVALITDKPPTRMRFKPSVEPFDRIVYADELGIKNFDSWIFKHDIVEACTAVKGAFLHQACNSAVDAVIYLDPDTAVLNSLSPLTDMLASDDIILTPHLLAPDNEDLVIRDNEVTALKAGIYNLGFLAVSTRSEARRFAKWWNDRCLNYCFDDVPSGLFVDQRWCDHVPSFFDNVRILKDPGYNVASWNLSNRTLEVERDGSLTVNGSPLRFWHFTKLGPVGDVMTKRYAKRNFHVYELWSWYKEFVAKHTDSAIPKAYWAYGAYDDGMPIDKQHRVTYRSRPDLQSMFVKPQASGAGSFQQWVLQSTPVSVSA